MLADGDPAYDGGVGTDACSTTDQCGMVVFRAVAGKCAAWRHYICEDHRRSAEHVVFQRHAVVDGNVILNLDKYAPPSKEEMIASEDIFMDSESIKDREQKYQDYKSGKIDKYFRDDTGDPDEIDFTKVPPITVVEQPDGKLEIVDGMHRVFLAKKNKAELPAWVIKLK